MESGRLYHPKIRRQLANGPDRTRQYEVADNGQIRPRQSQGGLVTQQTGSQTAQAAPTAYEQASSPIIQNQNKAVRKAKRLLAATSGSSDRVYDLQRSLAARQAGQSNNPADNEPVAGQDGGRASDDGSLLSTMMSQSDNATADYDADPPPGNTESGRLVGGLEPVSQQFLEDNTAAQQQPLGVPYDQYREGERHPDVPTNTETEGVQPLTPNQIRRREYYRLHPNPSGPYPPGKIVNDYDGRTNMPIPEAVAHNARVRGEAGITPGGTASLPEQNGNRRGALSGTGNGRRGTNEGGGVIVSHSPQQDDDVDYDSPAGGYDPPGGPAFAGGGGDFEFETQEGTDDKFPPQVRERDSYLDGPGDGPYRDPDMPAITGPEGVAAAGDYVARRRADQHTKLTNPGLHSKYGRNGGVEVPPPDSGTQRSMLNPDWSPGNGEPKYIVYGVGRRQRSQPGGVDPGYAERTEDGRSSVKQEEHRSGFQQDRADRAPTYYKRDPQDSRGYSEAQEGERGSVRVSGGTRPENVLASIKSADRQAKRREKHGGKSSTALKRLRLKKQVLRRSVKKGIITQRDMDDRMEETEKYTRDYGPGSRSSTSTVDGTTGLQGRPDQRTNTIIDQDREAMADDPTHQAAIKGMHVDNPTSITSLADGIINPGTRAYFSSPQISDDDKYSAAKEYARAFRAAYKDSPDHANTALGYMDKDIMQASMFLDLDDPEAVMEWLNKVITQTTEEHRKAWVEDYQRRQHQPSGNYGGRGSGGHGGSAGG